MFTTLDQFVSDSKVRWRNVWRCRNITIASAAIVELHTVGTVREGEYEIIAFIARRITRCRNVRRSNTR